MRQRDKFKADKDPKDVRVAVYDSLPYKDDVRMMVRVDMTKRFFAQFGYTNVTVYTDSGFSEKTFDRPDFNKMCADIEAGKIDAVFTSSAYSLCSVGSKLAIWLEDMYKKGIIVLQYGEVPDFSEHGELQRQLELLCLEYPAPINEHSKERLKSWKTKKSYKEKGSNE